jgi:hypothetical protein
MPPRKVDCPECHGTKLHSGRKNEMCPLAYAQACEQRAERLRERRASDPKFLKLERKRKREWARKKYASDPEYRERVAERHRNPEYLEKQRVSANKRYASNLSESRRRKLEWRREATKRAIDRGFCSGCHVREAEPLMRTCIRCQRRSAEIRLLGYSDIPLAKGSVG